MPTTTGTLSYFKTLLAACATIGAVAAPAHAALPTTANIQGALTAGAGGPAADGSYALTFAIYAEETGGAPVWSEGPLTVAAKGGQFAAQLGAKVPLSAAALSLPGPWLGVTVGSDPELPRRPLGSVLYALRAAVAESLECSGCIKAGSLDAGVLQPYAKATDLNGLAKAADLSAYAKLSDLLGYAKAADLADYVKASALAKVAGTGAYNDLSGTPVLAKVASTGDYADLKNVPAPPAVGKSCGTGLFLKGFNLDGSLNCVALKEGDMPADGLNEVSNGLLSNQYVDAQAGTADVAIKDGLGAGVTDTLTFPDIGLAQKLTVNMVINNSDLSGVKVELYGPNMAVPYILYDGGKTGVSLTAAFNDTTPIVSGDMNADWLGKNIKGIWSITVKDIKTGGGSGGLDGKFNWSIAIQTLSSKKVSVKGNLIVEGKSYGSGFCGNGIVEKGEQCDDGNNLDGDGCSAQCSAAAAEKNCAAILAKAPGTKSGLFTVDLDGAGPFPARTVACDMSTDGGGWTRFLIHQDPDGFKRLSVDDWNDAIGFAATGGIKQWLVKTWASPTNSTDAGGSPINSFVLNLNANSQGKAFTFFLHATNLSFDVHRWQGPGRIDSAVIQPGSNCKAWHASYNNGTYLWGEHRWSVNNALGFMWFSYCGNPASYHMLVVNHDYDYGVGTGRAQTLLGTDGNPGGGTAYDEDGGSYEFFFR